MCVHIHEHIKNTIHTQTHWISIIQTICVCVVYEPEQYGGGFWHPKHLLKHTRREHTHTDRMNKRFRHMSAHCVIVRSVLKTNISKCSFRVCIWSGSAHIDSAHIVRASAIKSIAASVAHVLCLRPHSSANVNRIDCSADLQTATRANTLRVDLFANQCAATELHEMPTHTSNVSMALECVYSLSSRDFRRRCWDVLGRLFCRHMVLWMKSHNAKRRKLIRTEIRGRVKVPGTLKADSFKYDWNNSSM